MSNNYFQFKQFRLEQSNAAMKFGTDSAILGAWANHTEPSSILDIGTGTGVLALMLAQRYTCQIDAVEIEKEAFLQAATNFHKSTWKDRLNAYHEDITTFDPNKKYELIVSNPPYFQNSLNSPDAKRQLARHNDSLPIADLVLKVIELLEENGLFFVVIPSDILIAYEKEIEKNGLSIQKKLEVVMVEGKAPTRVVLKIGREKERANVERLVVETKDRNYSQGYANLLKEYFLIF